MEHDLNLNQSCLQRPSLQAPGALSLRDRFYRFGGEQKTATQSKDLGSSTNQGQAELWQQAHYQISDSFLVSSMLASGPGTQDTGGRQQGTGSGR